ncbi:protein shisa-9A [Erpetoichthys calabaricus]|uniref:protein shisa-9A n=1 Tax=Erpetoichthys calabaricus TaxID=27687 RepID=UPI002233E820|nr:protein shisa-9A [Erpetoichthys calabaricus]
MAVYYLLWTCCVALRGDSAPLPSDTVRRFARSFPRQEFRVLECEMTRLGLLLCYFSVELLSFVCRAHGKSGQHLGSIVVVSGSNGSKDGEQLASDPPPTAEKCRGYFDVMGQWDPPFNCSTGAYLFCCGTCGFRYCCQFRATRLDQEICKNYDTPVWLMTGRPPSKRNDHLHDHTRDKTNLIVYIVCGVVAVMVLVGIFTKLGLEKAHRPHRENMSRALAEVMSQQRPCPGEHLEGEGTLGAHMQQHLQQHYETMQARPTANNLHGPQMNNVGPTSPILPAMAHPLSYTTLQLPHTYEQPAIGKELNKYATLKAVASEKVVDDFYSKRRHLAELAAKGSLPLHPVHMEPEESVHYSPDLTGGKQNGHKSKANKMHTHPLAFNSNTLKGWDQSEPTGRRSAYVPKKPCTVEQMNELQGTRGQHYLPPQPYFVTNSKTEVTV